MVRSRGAGHISLAIGKNAETMDEISGPFLLSLSEGDQGDLAAPRSAPDEIGIALRPPPDGAMIFGATCGYLYRLVFLVR